MALGPPGSAGAAAVHGARGPGRAGLDGGGLRSGERVSLRDRSGEVGFAAPCLHMEERNTFSIAVDPCESDLKAELL